MQNREIKLQKKHTFYSEHSLQVGDFVSVSHVNVPARVLFIDYVENLIYVLRSGFVPDELEGKRPYRSTEWPDFNFAAMKPDQLLFIQSKDDDRPAWAQKDNIEGLTISETDLKPLKELIIEIYETYLNN